MYKKTIYVSIISSFCLMSSAFAFDNDWLPEVPYDYKAPAEVYADAVALIDLKTATEAVYEETQKNEKDGIVVQDKETLAAMPQGVGLQAYLDPATGHFSASPVETKIMGANDIAAEVSAQPKPPVAAITPSPVEDGGLLLDVRDQIMPTK